MPSLSNGALQKATRKAVVSLFNDNSTLQNQFFTDQALSIILSEKCGVDIDADTVAKAFAAGGESRYSLQLKDMSIGHEGESVLFVYKAHRLLGGPYITAIGWFDSVKAAEAINPFVGKSIADCAIIDKKVKEVLGKQLKKDHEKKAKDKSTNKRPPSPSSEKPPSKKPSAATVTAAVEQEQTSNEQPADVDQTAAPTPELPANTPVPANGDGEMERAEHEEDASNQRADNERKEYTKKCRDVTIGKDTIHNVPYSLDVVQKNYLSSLRKKAKMIDNLMELFKEGRGKTVFQSRYLRFLSAVSLQNSGGSDNGTVTLIAATALVLIRSIGITESEISTESIANGCPGESTIAEYEYHVAAHLVMMQCRRINLSGVKYLTMTTDGGQRKGCEHMVKVFHFGVTDKDGNPTIGHLALDVDTCGKSSAEIAAAIKKSVAPIKSLLRPDIKINGLTGDSGGGGAVQHIHPKLIELGVMDKNSKYLRCIMHALSKPFENACKSAFGEQGLGKCTVFQLAYSAITLFRKLNEQGGLELVDKYSSKLLEVLNNSEGWEAEGTEMFPQAMNAYKAKIDDDDHDTIKEFTKDLRNLQLPVMTRWKTVPKALEFLVDNWVPTYFMSVVIIQKEGSKSALYQIACDIVSLMTLRPAPVEAASNADANGSAPSSAPSSEDGNIDTAAAAAAAPTLQKGDTPILLSQAFFLVAFSKYYFTPWFDSGMQPDPQFGSDSHGHNSRLFVQQTFLMREELDEMMGDNKWKEMPEFRHYIASLAGLPSLGDVKKGGLEFMNKATDTFFREYNTSFIKHIENVWTSTMILPYIIGGHPELAHEFIRWLRASDDGDLAADNFAWSTKEIEIENQKSYGESHECRIDACMICLTKNADPGVILEDSFIAEIKDSLFESLESEEVVNFLDRSRWQQADEYDPVRKRICEVVAPHASQQQRIECLVQEINAMARTNVKEARRTVRVVIFVTLNHPYNRESVDKKREERSTMKEKLKVKRVNGTERITGYFNHVEGVLAEAEKAVEEAGEQKYKDIFDHYRKSDNKTSAVEREKKVQGFEAATEKPRNITKNQRRGDIFIPIAVGGGIALSYFAKKRKNESVVREEIAFREIKLDNVQLRLNEPPLETMELDKMKVLLQQDEAARLARNDMVREEGTSWMKINSVDPLSQAMKDEVTNYLAFRNANKN